MSQAKSQYEPTFPKSHALLLHVYKNAIQSNGEESVVWCERLTALIKGWKTFKKDGLLPPFFTNNFGRDVQDVMKQVHDDLDTSKLTEMQSSMTFGVASLQMSFEGHQVHR